MTTPPDGLIELHCHADGLIDPVMLDKLAQIGQAAPITKGELESVWPVNSFPEWLKYLAVIEPCFNPAERLFPMVTLHIQELIRQKVVYAELMVSRLLASRGATSTPSERFRALRTAVDAVTGGQIDVHFIATIGRHTVERFAAQVEAILALAKDGLVVGIAVAGNELACPIRAVEPLLAAVRAAGIGIEIHAGEMAGPASVWDALEYGRPHRIGHGLGAFEDETLIKHIVDNDIHIEFCVTSNYRLGVLSDRLKHPVGRAKDLGMNFSVNTDDPGAFNCTLESEYSLLRDMYGFTEGDWKTISHNTWRSRFAQTGNGRTL